MSGCPLPCFKVCKVCHRHHHRKCHRMRHVSKVTSTGDLIMVIQDSSGAVTEMTYSCRDQSSTFQGFASVQDYVDTYNGLITALNSP